jgi:hypothetical protein
MVKNICTAFRLPFYMLIHPFNGFYAMKHQKQGRLWVAIVNLVLVCLSLAYANQYASIVVNEQNPVLMNSYTDMLMITGVLLLFCVSNWSVTSLADGEGKLSEIFMAIGYAMTPLILTIAPAALLSNALAVEESGFYFMILSVGLMYFVFLVFVGLITVHNYGLGKSLVTIALTFVALLIIVFLITLLFTLWQQLISFVQSLYTEIVFRR